LDRRSHVFLDFRENVEGTDGEFGSNRLADGGLRELMDFRVVDSAHGFWLLRLPCEGRKGKV